MKNERFHKNKHYLNIKYVFFPDDLLLFFSQKRGFEKNTHIYILYRYYCFIKLLESYFRQKFLLFYKTTNKK